MQFQNILGIYVKLFEAKKPDKSNDINELQSLNILSMFVHFVASKFVKFISAIELHPLNMPLQLDILSNHINLTIFI